jgi:hypothetical protein
MRFGFFDQLPQADLQLESQRSRGYTRLDAARLGEPNFIPNVSCLASPLREVIPWCR